MEAVVNIKYNLGWIGFILILEFSVKYYELLFFRFLFCVIFGVNCFRRFYFFYEIYNIVKDFGRYG